MDGIFTGGGINAPGSEVKLTAIPKATNAFYGWYEGGVNVSNAAVYTFTAEKGRSLEARFAPDKAVDSYTFTMGTWDMNSGTGNYSAQQRARAGELLKAQGASLVGLQFVNGASHADDIRIGASLSDYRYLQTISGQGNAALFNLPFVTEVSSDLPNDYSYEPRKLQKVVLRLPFGGNLSFYNTYLDHHGDHDLLEKQMTEIAIEMDNDTNPYKVLSGTFNTGSYSGELFQILTSRGYVLANGGNAIDIVFSPNIKVIGESWDVDPTLAPYSLPASNPAGIKPLFATLEICPVTGVTVSPERATLNPGETQQLTASVIPEKAVNKNVSWMSSNTSVATVDANGKVTANSIGSATISVTTNDGGYRAECIVTVTDTPTTKYTIALIADPIDGGSATGGGVYNAGELITVRAIPNQGYCFIGWYEDGFKIDDSEAYTFQASENRILTAMFDVLIIIDDPVSITVVADPKEGGSVAGGGVYLYNSIVTVTATPYSGYRFIGWYENGEILRSTTAAYSFVARPAGADLTLVARFAQSGLFISGGDVKGSRGQRVTVPIDIEGNPGLAGLQLEIKYDASALTLEQLGENEYGVTPGTALGSLMFDGLNDITAKNNPFKVAWAGASNDPSNGKILELTFIISESAEDKLYPITISYIPINTVDSNNNQIPAATKDGSVTVGTVLIGDVNGDGGITIYDAILIMQYVNGWDVPSFFDPVAADVDGDGEITFIDAMLILQYINGKISKFPVEG